jgi:hypothetical protein
MDYALLTEPRRGGKGGGGGGEGSVLDWPSFRPPPLPPPICMLSGKNHGSEGCGLNEDAADKALYYIPLCNYFSMNLLS